MLMTSSHKQYDIIIQSCCFVFLSFFHCFLEFVASVIGNVNKQVENFKNRRSEIQLHLSYRIKINETNEMSLSIIIFYISTFVSFPFTLCY